MTRDEILNLPAGQKMDALIAKKVFGFKLTQDEKAAYIPNLSGYSDLHLLKNRKYSSEIALAWKVVEKLAVEPYAWNIETVNKSGGCMYVSEFWGDGENALVSFSAYAETAPLAICRAALLFLENKESE